MLRRPEWSGMSGREKVVEALERILEKSPEAGDLLRNRAATVSWLDRYLLTAKERERWDVLSKINGMLTGKVDSLLKILHKKAQKESEV